MSRRNSNPAPCGLVQVIHLLWDKSARGGQGSRDRNSVPQAFDVPENRLLVAGNQLQIEESYWRQTNAFTAPTHYRHQRAPVEHGFRFRCTTVSAHPKGLLVRFRWDGNGAGAPNRWFINAPDKAGSASRDLIVPGGQWVRVCYNGRFVDFDTGNWWYEQTTVNVAWFTGEPSGRVFTQCAPLRDFRLLAELW